VLFNGDVENTNNSYGAISDEKVKQDIVDAASQWNDVKALRVRKFRFKADPTAPLQIGLVAQEAEIVSPGIVSEHPDYEEVEITDEEGNVKTERQPTGTVTKSVKYSVLYMKAIKALQEAMTRIEQLEAKVAATGGQIMDISTLKGAFKSKTVWWNILLALLASLELFAGHLTVLFGQNVASAVLLLGAMLNLALRVITTQPLSEK
jgi:hypothetical protein